MKNPMIALDSSVSEKNGNNADSNTITVSLTRVYLGNSVSLLRLLSGNHHFVHHLMKIQALSMKMSLPKRVD